MALVKATYIVNDYTNIERFVVNPPADYPLADGEKIVERFIEEDLYNRLATNLDEKIKIYRYVSISEYDDLTIPPKGLDYKTGLTTRLHPKPTIELNGLLTKMEFYASVEYKGGEYIYHDLILEATFSYFKDPVSGFVFHRTKSITWYKENGQPHPDKKVMFKVYTPTEMDEEAIQRRTNIVAMIKVELAQLIKELTEAQYPDPTKRPNSNDISKKVIGPFSLPILNYVNSGDKSITTIMASSKEPMLNVMWPKYGKIVKDVIVERIIKHG